PAPLDVLAQQIIAEVACQEWDEDALFELLRRAWPYRALQREQYAAVLRMVSEGFSTRQGQRGGYVHRDAVHHRLRERKGARMTALTSGGTIPETGDYVVMLEPQAQKIGTVNEDFAVESLAGDIFQLGNISYRILRVQPGIVRVEDARGAPPSIPFWLGEAPGRSDELSMSVSRLRSEFEQQWRAGSADQAQQWLQRERGLDEAAARQLTDYLGGAIAALGALPTEQCIVLERFFDESGGMQLVIHSPRGSRLNRAWGLALRKRFCRQFNFELQAAATEDTIILSLSTSHSFELAEVARYLHSRSAREVLVQALLDAPLFGVRWRWNAGTALALPRFQGGRKVPAQLQRMKSEDLLAAVFPDQLACLENLAGEREIPRHPLVDQTLDDCLNEAMDAPGWLAMLRRLEAGEIEVIARDTTAPSPLAAGALNAKPYAFLDDAPLEERRTQAVQSRRYTDPTDAGDLGRLDAAAIDAVRREAWPRVGDADEMHEALTLLGAVGDGEAAANAGWTRALAELARSRRATHLSTGLWVAAERLADLRLLHPQALCQPAIDPPPDFSAPSGERADALRELLRARLVGLGPVTVDALAAPLRLAPAEVEQALLALQTEGSILQGRFTPDAPQPEWCERHLLARIHRYTLQRLRQEIEPVEPRDFARFLFDWQKVGSASQLEGDQALPAVLAMLEGYEAAAGQWELDILPARLRDYESAWIDDLCTAGRLTWTRLRPAQPAGPGGLGGNSLRTTPVLLLPRRRLALWSGVAPAPTEAVALGSRAQRLQDYLAAHGASFFDEMQQGSRLLPAELEEALAELVVRGRASCDSFAGLRALMVPPSKRSPARPQRRPRRTQLGIEDAGRWSLLAPAAAARPDWPGDEALEHVARTLLRRYGVIAWRLLEREAAWLPPWRDLLRVYRRLEARGELRGGRFIAGLSGEQFALPEAIARMRELRRQPPGDALVCLSAADPANLLGTVLPGLKLPRTAGSRVLYRDGVPVATLVAGVLSFLVPLSLAQQREAGQRLRVGPARTLPAAALAPGSAEPAGLS
ncbi:MAG: ATP-dependent DNA helicase, partial [Burkholderiaceae bacterium]